MAAPRFSTRALVAMFSIAAVITMLGAPALGGRATAVGLTVAVLSVATTLAVHALFYCLAMGLAGFLGVEEVVARTSRGGLERSGRELALPSPPVAEREGSSPAAS